MKRSILAALAVILIAILCYILYNHGRDEGESVKALMEQQSEGKKNEDGNKRR